MAEPHEKKTVSITVKLPERLAHFVVTRSRQLSMESPPEYIRHLIQVDVDDAFNELSLLNEALQCQVSLETMESEEK
jgi:hypothetical protein